MLSAVSTGRSGYKEMRKVTVAIDVDGTLIQDGATSEHDMVANERTRTLLILLARMKNTRIIVWSGRGRDWARLAAIAIGVEQHVDSYADKVHVTCELAKCEAPKNTGGFCGTHHFAPTLRPDIAIDDIQACELGGINLIVREK